MVKAPKTKRSFKSALADKLEVEGSKNFKHLWRVALRKYWHGIFAILYIFLVLEFRLLEKYIVPTTWVSCALDQYIPFIPIFIIPYSIWYPMIGVVLVRLCFNDREDFLKTCMSVYTGMTIAMILFILFPNGQTLRPVITDDNVLANMVRTSIYSRDTNTNSFPSIHVLKQISIHVGICKSKLWANNKKVKNISLVISILVCASTVFIKQHSILDVIGSLIISIPVYILVYKFDWISLFPKKLHGRIKRWETSEVKI